MVVRTAHTVHTVHTVIRPMSQTCAFCPGTFTTFLRTAYPFFFPFLLFVCAFCPGTLTTFLRTAYPSAVVGGLAASAPIGYYDPQGVATDTSTLPLPHLADTLI